MPKPTEEQLEKLAAVKHRRSNEKKQKTELRAYYDALYDAAISGLEAETAQAVRAAADADCAIRWIQDAYATSDFRTIKNILEATPSIVSVQKEAAKEGMYSWADDEESILDVHYFEHGPESLTGNASFDVIELDDGAYMLSLRGGDDEISKRLDGRFDGFYYDEALGWIRSN